MCGLQKYMIYMLMSEYEVESEKYQLDDTHDHTKFVHFSKITLEDFNNIIMHQFKIIIKIWKKKTEHCNHFNNNNYGVSILPKVYTCNK